MASELQQLDAEEAERNYRERAGVNTIKALFGDTSANYYDMPTFTADHASIVAPSFENLSAAEKRAIMSDEGALGYITSALDWAEQNPQTGVIPNPAGTGKGAMRRPPKGGVAHGTNPLEAFSQYIQSNPALSAQWGNVDQGSINTLANYLEDGGLPGLDSDAGLDAWRLPGERDPFAYARRELYNQLEANDWNTDFLTVDPNTGDGSESAQFQGDQEGLDQALAEIKMITAPWGRWDQLGFDPLTPSNPLEAIGYDPAALQSQAKNAATARDSQYQSMYDTLMEEYDSGRTRQRDRSASDLKTAMVRRGLTGGSVEADLMAELTRMDLEEASNLTGAAQTARDTLRDKDAALMSDLVGSVKAGGDLGSAVGNATSGMTSNFSNILDQSKAALTNDIFAEFNSLFNTQQYVDGRLDARVPGKKTGVVTPGSTTSGYRGNIVG